MTVQAVYRVQYLGFSVQLSFPQGAEFSTGFPQVFHRVGKNCVQLNHPRTLRDNRGERTKCTSTQKPGCTVVITYLSEKRFFDVKGWLRAEIAYYNIFSSNFNIPGQCIIYKSPLQVFVVFSRIIWGSPPSKKRKHFL